MLADMARIRPLGMFFSGSFVSSDSLTISSKPMNAKNIWADAWNMPDRPKGVYR
jgi:hypothetical protein